MTTLTINRKPKGIYGTPQKTTQAAQEQDKTKVIPGNQNAQQKPTGATPWRHMTKRQRKNRRRVNRLTEMWPDLFNREAPKPLKVGIFDDLMQDIAVRGLTFGPGALRATLASYAQSPRYYRALMAGGARYDLKGQPCGEVTPQEQQEAEMRLMAMNEKRQRRAAKGDTCQ
ncbi:TPA: proQ/FINO family protein [Escherichia coli]|uniref:ProQ/FinO family protein n=1 Tax=Escherichia coli TaxID=562 RepID=UPI00176AC670|nr:ProQ/FinO family protein [Escherichia coli]HDQ6536324.1 ProQ/FinO family protein [Escherichia coli O36:H14]EKA1090725.1 ProQ/FinO family protein [Escherichia coli]ELB9148978.1 ProQ/FinO family protein [Escherichia coli]ELX2059695.1 ProQ/FinO family protein [Escherichia coli]MDM4038243.1 ProQ/FinO family protein [Escherichia coli]